MDETTNATERRRWNDPYWAGVWPKREQLTGAVTELLLDSAELATGQRVLDIGSGAGITTLEAARRVGPTGSVVGADVSVPLCNFASRRAEQANASGVKFVVADMQMDSVDGPPFDAAISQFGVMFFEAPTTAFANIRHHLLPGSRFSFACWQPLALNRWHLNHAVGDFLMPPRSDGPLPGPFGLSDPVYAMQVLHGAGWNAIERQALEVNVTVRRDAIVDDDQLTFIGISPPQLEAAEQAVNRHLAEFRRADGNFDLTLAIQLFTCSA